MKIRHISSTLAGVIGGATLVAVSLSAGETPAPKPPVCIYQTLEQVDAEFKQRDSDGNGVLSLAEFTAKVPQDPSGATHRFRIVDLDRNDQLSPAEFRAAVRFEVPDPWNDLATAARDKVLTIIRAADQDADGALTRKEWPGTELHAEIRPFGEIDFVKWDANSDGKLVEAEIRQLVDFAYGLTLQTGESARWPNGTLLDWTYLKHLDQNGDHRISRAEFTARHVESREQNEKLFEELNTTRDDHLSFAEISASSDIARKHPIGVFTNLDKNADGLLSFEEITVDMPPAQVQGRTLTLLLAAFDENGDKQLNFVEFQRSPLGVRPLIANLLNRKDRNQDGLVSWTEFHAVPQPQFAGIAWEIFQRFDQDHDLELSPEEYDFPLARGNAQANQQEAQWQPYARQILRAELRYFLMICPPNAEQRQALKPVVEQLLPRTVRQLVADQQPRARNAVAVRDPRAMITEQFSQFAREHLPADTAADYQQENALRLKQRQQATVLNLVARLDRELRLSEEQRLNIAAALQEHWQPAWEQQMELQAQNLQRDGAAAERLRVAALKRRPARSMWIAQHACQFLALA
ncbi:MAG: hypothetical protein U0872_02815 [Planctomycetaceae bacterium]